MLLVQCHSYAHHTLMVVQSLIHHHLVAERLSVFACADKLYAFSLVIIKLPCLVGSCSVSLRTLKPVVYVWFWGACYLVGLFCRGTF
jgi:hypothetical protein